MVRAAALGEPAAGWAREYALIRDEVETACVVVGIAVLDWPLYDPPSLRLLSTQESLGRWERRLLDIGEGLDLLNPIIERVRARPV